MTIFSLGGYVTSCHITLAANDLRLPKITCGCPNGLACQLRTKESLLLLFADSDIELLKILAGRCQLPEIFLFLESCVKDDDFGKMTDFKAEVELVDPLSKVSPRTKIGIIFFVFFFFFFLAAAVLALLSVLVAPTITIVLAVLHDLVFQISPYSRVPPCGNPNLTSQPRLSELQQLLITIFSSTI